MKSRQTLIAAGLLLLGSAAAQAVPVYSSTYPSPNSACATFGNMVSCSTAVLDYLHTQYPSSFPSGSYAPDSSQGKLIDTIVIATNNGNILNNADQVTPSEKAFTTQNGGQQAYFYTGDNNDPVNSGSLSGDTDHSWDIGLSALNSKLTINGVYHQMMIGMDFNNPQGNTSASLPIWSLVTIRDLQDPTRNLYFETQALDTSGGASTIFKDPGAFVSGKTFNPAAGMYTTPGAGDFAMTVASICVVNATVSYPSPDGTNCPAGGTLVSTNRASNEADFVNYFPTLDLRDLQSQGYDTMSVQVWMGCFNTIDPKKGGIDSRSGPALLDGGSIGPCDNGGFGDIFLLAGAAQPEIPEPGSMALVGLGLLGAAAARRRGARKN